MICIHVDIPQDICQIDDELKALYHTKDAVCIFLFKTRAYRNEFIDKTIGIDKQARLEFYLNFRGAELAREFEQDKLPV
jgi:hypothetical protein